MILRKAQFRWGVFQKWEKVQLPMTEGNGTRNSGYFSSLLEWRKENSGGYQIAVILMLIFTWILTIHFSLVSSCSSLISRLV